MAEAVEGEVCPVLTEIASLDKFTPRQRRRPRGLLSQHRRIAPVATLGTFKPPPQRRSRDLQEAGRFGEADVGWLEIVGCSTRSLSMHHHGTNWQPRLAASPPGDRAGLQHQ